MKALIRKRIPLRTNNNSTTPLTIDSASSCGGDLNSSKVQQRDDDTQGQGQTEAAPLPETPQHTLTTEKNVEEHEPNTIPTAAATAFKSGDSSSLIRSCSTEGTTTTAQIRMQQRTIPVLRRRKRLRATRRTNNNNNDESDSRGEHQKTSPLEPTSHNNNSVINHSSTTDSPQIDASTASTTTTTTTTIVTKKKKKKQPPQQISLRDFASQVHSQQNLNPLWRSSSSSTATTTQAGSDLPPTSSHLVALTSSAFIPEQQQEHQQQATADPPRLSSTLQFEHPVFTAQELEILSFINQKAGECLEALGFCGERFIASVGDSAQQEFCAESAQHDYEGRVGYGFGDDFGDGNEIIMQDIIDENGVVCYSNNNSNHYHHHAEELEPIIPYSQEDSQEGNNMSSFTVLCGGSITIQVTTKASALINCDKDEEGEEDKQTTTEYEIAVHAKSLDEVEVTSHFCKLYGGSTHIVFPKIVSVVMHLQLQNSEVEFVLRLDDAITKVFKAADDLVLHPFDDYRISSQSQQHSWDATQELLMMMSSLHLPPSPTASSSFRRTLSKEKFTELFQSFDVGIGGAADESHNFTCSSALAVVRASEHPDLTRMKILTSVNRLPLLPMGEKQYSGGEGEERERGDATIPDFIENVDQATWRNLIFNIGIRQRGLIDDYLSEQCNIEVLVSDDDAINNINIKSNKDRTGHASSLWLRLRNKKEDELLSLYLFVDISLPQHEVYVENLEALIGNLVEQSVINAFEDNNYFFNQHRKQRREGAHRHHHHHQEESGNKNKKRSINPEDHKLETLLLPSICASLHSIILTSTNPHFQQECARLLSLHPAAEMEQGQDAHSGVYTATADDLERRIREVVNDTYQHFNGSRLSTTTTTTTNRKKSTKKKKTAKQQQQQQQQSQQPQHQMGDQQQQQYHPEARQVPQKQEQEQQQDGLHSQQQQRQDTPQPHGLAVQLRSRRRRFTTRPTTTTITTNSNKRDSYPHRDVDPNQETTTTTINNSQFEPTRNNNPSTTTTTEEEEAPLQVDTPSTTTTTSTTTATATTVTTTKKKKNKKKQPPQKISLRAFASQVHSQQGFGNPLWQPPPPSSSSTTTTG